ncbi:MAG: hypothetical protein ACKOJE_00465, partial [Bacteroidota bacterium]
MWILLGYALIAPWRSLAQPVLPPGITARFYTTFQNANPLDSVIVTGLWDTVSTYRFPAAPAGLSVRGRINSSQTSILELKPFSTLGHFKVWLDFAHIAKLEFNDTAIVQYSLDQGATWTRLLGAPCRYLGTSVSFPQPLTSGGSRFHQQSYPADWLAGGNLGALPQASWWKQERFD